MQALSQLSYTPTKRRGIIRPSLCCVKAKAAFAGIVRTLTPALSLSKGEGDFEEGHPHPGSLRAPTLTFFLTSGKQFVAGGRG